MDRVGECLKFFGINENLDPRALSYTEKLIVGFCRTCDFDIVVENFGAFDDDTLKKLSEYYLNECAKF